MDMTRATTLLLVLIVIAAGCGGTKPPTTPTPPGTFTFTAVLSPANEVPPISNAENTGSGSVTITLGVVRDASGAITSATASFAVTLTGFPATINLTAAHIHEGPSTCACPVRVNTGLANGQVVLTNGAGSFTKDNIAVAGDLATNIVNNTGNFYFNVHSTVNGGGFARGILVLKQ
jgi:hypothetical protein